MMDETLKKIEFDISNIFGIHLINAGRNLNAHQTQTHNSHICHLDTDTMKQSTNRKIQQKNWGERLHERN